MFSFLDGTQQTEKLPKTATHRTQVTASTFFLCKYHDIASATFLIKSLENLKTAHLNFKSKCSIILFFQNKILSVKKKKKKKKARNEDQSVTFGTYLSLQITVNKK